MIKELPVIKLIIKYTLILIGIEATVGIIEGIFDFADYSIFSLGLDFLRSIVIILLIREANQIIYNENIFDKFNNKLGLLKTSILSISIVILCLIAIYFTKPIADQIPTPELFKEIWNEILKKPDTNLEIIIAFISIAIIAPLVEEIVFRGFIYKTLRTKYNISFSIFISFVLFYLFHLDPQMLIMLSIVSIALCLSYEYSQSLTLPVLIHSGINISSLLLSWYGTS